MNDITNYINRYKDKTFLEKDFTEIDNIIFSLLIYIPFNGIIPYSLDESITIKDAFHAYESLAIERRKKVPVIVKNAKKMLKQLASTKRYGTLKLCNYQYSVSETHQFGAFCVLLPNNTMYVSFKGTDDFVSGWEEDFRIFYKYPVVAQKLAIDYLRKTVKIFGPNIIVGGHSKGGNLAIVSSMNLSILKKKKILKIYSNDGLGLTEQLINSFMYQTIKDRVINFIPTSSFIGVLLRKGEYFVVKSSSVSLFQHNAFTWNVIDDHFERGKQDKNSKQIEKIVSSWLSNYDNKKMEELVDSLFLIFKEAGIRSFLDFQETKIKTFIKLISASRKLDIETKKIVRKSMMLLIEEIKQNDKEEVTN